MYISKIEYGALGQRDGVRRDSFKQGLARRKEIPALSLSPRQDQVIPRSVQKLDLLENIGSGL